MKAKQFDTAAIIRAREIGKSDWIEPGIVLIANRMSRSLAIDLHEGGFRKAATRTLLLVWVKDGESWAWKELRSGQQFEIEATQSDKLTTGS